MKRRGQKKHIELKFESLNEQNSVYIKIEINNADHDHDLPGSQAPPTTCLAGIWNDVK